MTDLRTPETRTAEPTVFERFEAIAEAHPAEIAYANGPVTMTYSQLAALARAARARIQSMAPSSPGFVGILTVDRANALAGILGAAGSGHAYVLLDVNDPDKRLRHIVGEVSPFAILADEALLSRAEGLAGRGGIISLDTLEPRDGDQDITGLPVSPDSLLYVSFTSGSTGVPKGVAQTHRNLAFYVDAYIDAMEIGAGDRISWLFAHGASASNMDIYGALFTGARLCAFELRDESFPAIARWIDKQRIALLHTVPTVVRELVGAIEKDKVFASVRTVDLAGEMLFANDVARMRPHFRADCRIFNRLAATEASFISSLIVTRAHEKIDGPLPVGQPPDGVELGILRTDGTPADIGEIGAIAIDSPYVCTGYFNRADLNAEVFCDLDGRPGWRRFKSPDLGLIDNAGNLNFIGRSGSRIKLRGQAVDLAEVEAALYECPGVTGAVVLPRSESGEEAREILAYLTLAPGVAQEAGDIRKHLAQSLPAYMLPSGYVFLDKFPYTATSKVDRQALGGLDLAKVRFRPGYVAPENEVEEKLAAIFSELLNVPSVGRFDDFFLLGGDSLSLVNLQILAREALGRELPPLHEDATVHGVARKLHEAENGADHQSSIVVPIRTEGSSPPLFVVHGRRGQAHVGPHFVELLGKEQPLYALQARGLDGKQEPHETIEAMAAEYVAAIREVQPRGPYLLGGFCAGCYVALEMIDLLLKQGKKYFAPLFIDPPPPGILAEDDDIPEEVFLWKLKHRAKAGQWNVDLENPDAVEAAINVARSFEYALRAHDPKLIPIRSMVIATRQRWGHEDLVRKTFGPRADVFLVEGDHLGMLSPDNEEFAAALGKCVADIADRAERYRAAAARRKGRSLPSAATARRQVPAAAVNRT